MKNLHITSTIDVQGISVTLSCTVDRDAFECRDSGLADGDINELLSDHLPADLNRRIAELLAANARELASCCQCRACDLLEEKLEPTIAQPGEAS